MKKIDISTMDYEYYGCGTYAYYDRKSDSWYNEFGTKLRNPIAYDTHSEGYTPFGDE
jgi:hypothetical protein